MKLADKAFFFDNTMTNIKQEYSFFAEKSENSLHIKNESGIPWWFSKCVLGEDFLF
jgi:hypothetical protein